MGATPAYFDLNISQLGIIRLLQTLKPKVMFVAEEDLQEMLVCIKKSGVNIDIVVFGESDKFCRFYEYLQPDAEENNFLPVRDIDIKETAVILFSSGTTGPPKGICLSHYSLLKQCTNNFLFGQYSGDLETVYLMYSTLYWISSTATLVKSIICGHTKVICKKFDPRKAWEIIEKYKVSAKIDDCLYY